MTTRLDAILEQLDRWRAEGLVSDEQHGILAADARESADARMGDTVDADEVGGAGGYVPRDDRGSFAADALQFVGGLLLGAALVALTVFLDLEGDAAEWTLVGLGALGIAAGAALHYLAPDRNGVEEALMAAGLVAVGVSAAAANDGRAVAVLGMMLAIAALVVRQGRGPTVVVAGAAFVAASFAAAGPEFFGARQAPPEFWWLLLVGYGALMLVWRKQPWTSAALGLYVLPLTLSFADLIDSWGVRDTLTTELVLGVYLGALLALGIALGIRGLVAGAAAGLTIDAVTFAADLGGAGTAVVVLLVLGGLLVWQAEFLRAYFTRRGSHGRGSG